jgi:hypothetical protein
MKGVVWDDNPRRQYQDIDIPADMLDQARGIPREND